MPRALAGQVRAQPRFFYCGSHEQFPPDELLARATIRLGATTVSG